MFFLKPLSYIFLFFVKFRIFLYKSGILKTHEIKGSKIVSIGNISLGGTGKTPVTVAIAENLIKKGFSVSILLRGYKRKSSDETVIVHNGEKMLSSPEISGDEAYLTAKKLNCPVVVSGDRVKGAKLLKEKFMPDFILLDDGFQHLKLKRDKDIVLLTEKSLNEKIYVLPAKKFREPLSHLKRADLIIITKIINKKSAYKKAVHLKQTFGKSVYIAEMLLESYTNIKTEEKLSPTSLFGKKCVIFCAIAQPIYFEQLLTANGVNVIKKFYYPDHYYYKKKDYKKIDKLKEHILITTEKDGIKLNVKEIEAETLLTANIKYSFYKT